MEVDGRGSLFFFSEVLFFCVFGVLVLVFVVFCGCCGCCSFLVLLFVVLVFMFVRLFCRSSCLFMFVQFLLVLDG